MSINTLGVVRGVEYTFVVPARRYFILSQAPGARGAGSCLPGCPSSIEEQTAPLRDATSPTR